MYLNNTIYSILYMYFQLHIRKPYPQMLLRHSEVRLLNTRINSHLAHRGWTIPLNSYAFHSGCWSYMVRIKAPTLHS